MILNRRRVLRPHLSSYRQEQQRPLPPLPSALSPLHDEASHPTPQSQPQPQLVQQFAASSNWFFRNASKNGNSTTTTHTSTGTSTNSELGSTHSSPSTGLVRSTSSKDRRRVGSGRDGDGNPPGNNSPTFHSTRTPNASRTNLSERGESSASRKMSGKGNDVSGSRNLTLTAMMTPAKLVKRKSFGFVHLGRGFGGHGGGENEVVGQIRSKDVDEDGEGKQ